MLRSYVYIVNCYVIYRDFQHFLFVFRYPHDWKNIERYKQVGINVRLGNSSSSPGVARADWRGSFDRKVASVQRVVNLCNGHRRRID